MSGETLIRLIRCVMVCYCRDQRRSRPRDKDKSQSTAQQATQSKGWWSH